MRKNVSLLVVEDSREQAQATVRAFKANNIDNPVIIASSGIDALNQLRGENGCDRLSTPYIILLDINMRDRAGYTFLQELRDDQALRQSIVFVFSHSEIEEDIRQAYHYRIAGYISKSQIEDDLSSLSNLLSCYSHFVEFPHRPPGAQSSAIHANSA